MISYRQTNYSFYIFIAEAYDVCLLHGEVGALVLHGVGRLVLRRPVLRLVISSEIREHGLCGDGLAVANVCDLECFLAERPFIPLVVGVNVLFDEVGGGLHVLVHH